MRIQCPGKAPRWFENKNHGTGKDDLHKNGNLMLRVVKSRTVKASEARALRMAEVIKTCSCDSSTQFLAADKMKPDVAVRLLAIAQKELRCRDASVKADVIAAFSGHPEGLVRAQDKLLGCSWGSKPWAPGLTSALARALG